MNHFEYAVATIEDIPKIVEMKMDMFKESGHVDLLASNAYSIILDDYKELYEKKIASHFIAKSNGVIVATVGAFIKSDIPFRYYSTPMYGFIGDVYVVKNYRHKGVARRLSQNALSWFKIKEVTMVKLLASEAARPIYKQLGFVDSDEMVLKIGT